MALVLMGVVLGSPVFIFRRDSLQFNATKDKKEIAVTTFNMYANLGRGQAEGSENF